MPLVATTTALCGPRPVAKAFGSGELTIPTLHWYPCLLRDLSDYAEQRRVLVLLDNVGSGHFDYYFVTPEVGGEVENSCKNQAQQHKCQRVAEVESYCVSDEHEEPS